MSILAVLSYVMAKSQGEAPWKIVGEHLLIAFVVVGVTHLVGDWVGILGG
jgi:VIT1/CCC1 family predicted Fe2+/Mn2+ transporter